jgi:glycosyltransferase involved in cell wall biosynthesis
MKKLRILHITESNGFSGGVNQSYQLAKGLSAMGHINYFAAPENGILYQMVKKENFNAFNFKPNGSLDIKTIKNLKKLFEEYRFDVVHTHHSRAHHYSFIAKKISDYKPVIIASRRVIHPIPKNIFAEIRYKSKDIDAYIAVCEYVKKILTDYGIDEKKVFVIYSGVDTKRFRPQDVDFEFKKSLRLNNNDFVISHIGNFSDEKGQIYTVKAAKILADKGYRFKLLFAGMRTDSEDIKKLFKDNQLSLDYGVFLGLRMDVENILNITDISVNSSIRGEALSGSIRESLASGVPVVASDIGGNSEIVKDGYNGFLFKPSKYEDLAQKIEIFVKNHNLRKEFSQNAIKTIENKFTIDRMVDDTLRLYCKLGFTEKL